MIDPRPLAWGLLFVPACFHPIYDHPACGPNGECPSGWTCNAQQVCDKDNSTVDASVGPGGDAIGPPDGFDGTCNGPAGWQACFTSTSPPSGTITLPASID